MSLALVERAMHGDQEAFASLATASADRCYGLAYRILRDHYRAQDATQQALLGAWRDLPTLRDPERFDAWLHRLVVHACYAESRTTRRWRASVDVIRFDTSTHHEPDLARAVADRADLDDAFRALTPEQRAVVVLHFYADLPLTEIAAALGVPAGTARSRLHYALTRLRAALDAVDAPRHDQFAGTRERSA